MKQGVQDGGEYTSTNDIPGIGNEATLTQDGFLNYVYEVNQQGISNYAKIVLDGIGNGAKRPTGVWAIDQLPSRGELYGAADDAAGAYASSVVQEEGPDNKVDYRVSNGNDNQFGFYQKGDGNEALAITITGDRNHLGVSQDGSGNALLLGTITGDDNVVGLVQNGDDNVARIDITGNENGGYKGFTALSNAASLNLTAGLLKQVGDGNEVQLTVKGLTSGGIGTGNVFASLQDTNGKTGLPNKIVATQAGTNNEAAIAQNGVNNFANLSQTGGNNNASISQ